MLACMKHVQVNNAKPYFRPFVFEISTHELCRYLFAGVFLFFCLLPLGCFSISFKVIQCVLGVIFAGCPLPQRALTVLNFIHL